MLVVRRGDEVLLERRPPSGVWGGLWSLPESCLPGSGTGDGAADALAGELERRFGLRVSQPRALARFDHAFTHFRLQVQPVACELIAAGAVADVHDLLWLPLESAGDAALPRPVKTLLQGLPLRSPDAAADTGRSATGA
jgi:A/G-specific adenine glycosylase